MRQSFHILMLAAALTAGTWPTQASAQGQPAAPSAPAQTNPAMAAAPTLFMIRYRPGPSYREGIPLLQQDLRAHGAYMQDLTRRGIIIAAGPTFVDTGGLVLLSAENIEEARRMMQEDPAVRSGIFVGTVSDWRPFFDPGGRFRSESERR